MFDDDKHIAKQAVGKFVSNIKRTLEKAHGIARPNNNSRQQYRKTEQLPQSINANVLLSRIAELITRNTYTHR